MKLNTQAADAWQPQEAKKAEAAIRKATEGAQSAPPHEEALLHIDNLHKRFGDLNVLEGIHLQVRAGEVIGLIGPSGSGKSTLLRCINQLERPTSGTVRFRGQRVEDANLDRMRRDIGMVFQRFHLFAHLNALQNVALAPRKVLGMSARQAEQLAREQLAGVHLADKAQAFPSALSGGQQQRVAIARALAMSPALLLCDEPTSALDPELVGEVLGVLRDLAAQGRTMLIATHEMQFCREVADRVLFLDGGQIVEEGPPSVVLYNPTHPRTAQFLARVLNP